MTLCDLRDCAGDRLTGVRTVPVLLGPSGSRRLLLVLLAAIQCAILACRNQAPFKEFWGVLAWVVPVYLGALWWAVRRPRSERFYEWAVEGMLYLPLGAWGLAAG
jgi:4-hydroxybenzoate polyprenyltransferase